MVSRYTSRPILHPSMRNHGAANGVPSRLHRGHERANQSHFHRNDGQLLGTTIVTFIANRGLRGVAIPTRSVDLHAAALDAVHALCVGLDVGAAQDHLAVALQRDARTATPLYDGRRSPRRARADPARPRCARPAGRASCHRSRPSTCQERCRPPAARPSWSARRAEASLRLHLPRGLPPDCASGSSPAHANPKPVERQRGRRRRANNSTAIRTGKLAASGRVLDAATAQLQPS